MPAMMSVISHLCLSMTRVGCGGQASHLELSIAPAQLIIFPIVPGADRWLERNNLTGTIPPSWAGLPTLERLVIKPGEAKFCSYCKAAQSW